MNLTQCDICNQGIGSDTIKNHLCRMHYIINKNPVTYRFFHFCSLACRELHMQEYHLSVDIS